MDIDTYDNLSAYVGKKLSNKAWKDLISSEFGVSRSCANEMIHAMMMAKRIHELNNLYERNK